MKRCRKCAGSLVVYDRNIQQGSVGEVRLCECVEQACTCGGVPPYQAFDSDGTHHWCACREARMKLDRVKKAFRDTGLPPKFRMKFSDDFEVVSPKASKVIGLIGTIRDKDPAERWRNGLYLWGPPGSGKTLLASIILNELIIKYGQPGKFIDLSRQFFHRLKRSFDVADETYGTSGKILDELINVPFLVIDDFGVQRNTEWESETLYNLIDSRYADERITIITSNDTINKYKDIAHGRVYSRILEMCQIVHIDLPDYREKFSQFI